MADFQSTNHSQSLVKPLAKTLAACLMLQSGAIGYSYLQQQEELKNPVAFLRRPDSKQSTDLARRAFGLLSEAQKLTLISEGFTLNSRALDSYSWVDKDNLLGRNLIEFSSIPSAFSFRYGVSSDLFSFSISQRCSNRINVNPNTTSEATVSFEEKQACAIK